MSVRIRLIPCLDVANGKVVKGRRFENLREIGDPLTLFQHYQRAGADEIVILDISATIEQRKTLSGRLRQFLVNKNIPLTVGGGIRTFDDAQELFDSGADRVSINSALYSQPKLVEAVATRYGSQAVVAAIDYRSNADGSRQCAKRSGTEICPLSLEEMVFRCMDLGVGELLLTSIDRDGTKTGYDTESIRSVRNRCRLPLTASGGAGTIDHLVAAYNAGATGILIAGQLHDGFLSLEKIRAELKSNQVPVRSIG